MGSTEMGRYPRSARQAAIKCIPCNAPAIRTVGGDYVCVECGIAIAAGIDGGRRLADGS